jgi:hypothetical protein
MKIIEFDESNPYAFQMYYNLNNILQFGYIYLPFIFLQEVNVIFESRKIQIPRWITKLYYESLDNDVQDLIQELNQKLLTNKQ